MTADTKNKNLIERLFKAGAHFGFQKSRRHPTVKPFLYGVKQGTDIFDLEQSAALLDTAKTILEDCGKNGKVVLFVGTKEEISKLVRESAEKADSPFVTNRWIGGMLTNWSEIKKRINRLKELTAEGESGELERKYTKKERVIIGREADKLNYNFGGIKDIEKNPDLLVIVDPRHDHIAATEARDMKIPVIAVMSSDSNINLVDHPVVLNDSLQASVRLALEELTGAYLTGKSAYVPKTIARAETPRHNSPKTVSAQ